MSIATRILLSVVAMSLVVAFGPAPASARPLYFDTLVAKYGIVEGDDLFACGVCHLLWTGTGQRNPYGNAVEQQLYVGRTIDESLTLIEDDDADGDTFSNVDELVSFMTLPGYNCANFIDAKGAPQGYDAYVTPGVATCLEDKDVRIIPGSLGVFVRVGDTDSLTLTIFNNGSSEPLHIDSVAFEPPTALLGLELDGAATPLDIPVGASEEYTITYSPSAAAIYSGAIRVVSDDPDVEEQQIDTPLQIFGFVVTLGSPADRAQCHTAMAKDLGRFSKTHFSEWGRCHFSELEGVICDSGKRDFKVNRAAAKFASTVGGSRDNNCGGNGMTRTLLDYPTTCGGNCGDLTVGTLPSIGDCLVCRQDDAMQSALSLLTGSAPPGLPGSTVSDSAQLRCLAKIERTTEKSIGQLFKAHAACEIAGVASETTPDCATDLESRRTKTFAKIQKYIDRCRVSLEAPCIIEGVETDCDTYTETVDTIVQDMVRGLLGRPDSE
ncbi:MAG: hypothetical protein ACI8TX_003091 [Hyphomicrobiaceae bacterium]